MARGKSPSKSRRTAKTSKSTKKQPKRRTERQSAKPKAQKKAPKKPVKKTSKKATVGKRKTRAPIDKKRRYVARIEEEILEEKGLEEEVKVESEDSDSEKEEKPSRSGLEQLLFKVPYVTDPLIGTPKQVQEQLDALAKSLQKRPNNNAKFNKIHLYMHGYLINVVLKKFPYIRGFQTTDIYQEALIALRFKAIPNFDDTKGMSFLNFAKMCIRRHLITLLNTSQNRQRDRSINQAVSLDSCPTDSNGEQDGKNTLGNIIGDSRASADEELECNEAFDITKSTLLSFLSEFERMVLEGFLVSSSYEEIAKNVSKKVRKRCKTKSVDNALLRIRKKATQLMKHGKLDDIPLFIQK